nr:MAG TPA: hypothetical protein [Caudoviricetes sp.]
MAVATEAAIPKPVMRICGWVLTQLRANLMVFLMDMVCFFLEIRGRGCRWSGRARE